MSFTITDISRIRQQLVMRIKAVNHLLSTFLAIYLLNCYQVISFLPNPDTLFITSSSQSSVMLNLSCSAIRFRSSMSRTSFFLGSTRLNIALLPCSLKGLPTFSVIKDRKVSKLTHSPAKSQATPAMASYTILYFLSKPRVRAVLSISATSHCRWLSQYRLNISKNSQQCSFVKTGFLVTTSLAKTIFLSFSAFSLRLCSISNLTIKKFMITDKIKEPQQQAKKDFCYNDQ